MAAATGFWGALAGLGGNIVGGVLQSRATDRATKAQAAAAANALKFEQDVYGNDVRDFGPTKAAGDAAILRLSDMYSRRPAPVTAASVYAAGDRSAQPMNMGQMRSVGASQTPAAAAQMITVTAPTGQTQQRPASEREHWIAKGARVA